MGLDNGIMLYVKNEKIVNYQPPKGSGLLLNGSPD